MAVDDTATVEALEERLRRYPPERYPVQHATTQYHLGVALAGAGRLDGAAAALVTACQLFRADQLPAEHAKAANALGAVQRMSGHHDRAASSFQAAASLFATAALPLEQGAALFNLGLVERERGGAGALAALEQALDLLDPARVPAQAAAAARELGAALLAAGRPEEAVPLLDAAVDLSARAGDRTGLGGSANVLGLAHLAAGRPADAIAALDRAAAAHPRSVRPDGYSMAKANLGLALEANGRPIRARLVALQALGAPSVPPAVRTQAQAVLERVGSQPGALWAALDEEQQDRWPALVREEMVRWVDAGPAPREAECQAWVAGQLERPVQAVALAEAFLGALVELPPPAVEVLARCTLETVGQRADDEQQRFARAMAQALARLPVPQLLRFKDIFEHLAGELGLAATSW